MLKKSISVTLLAIFLPALMAGCASQTTEQKGGVLEEHKGATVGAGAGAVAGGVAGGVIGAQSGHTTAGIVIGALLGGLAGAAIGHYAYDKKQTEAEAQKKYDYDYNKTQANLVRVESVSAVPSKVGRGDTVELVAKYTVLGPQGTSMDVTETREVRHEGTLEGKPQITVKREGGTYESKIPLGIPENAQPGQYTVITTVQSGTSSDSRETAFTVFLGGG